MPRLLNYGRALTSLLPPLAAGIMAVASSGSALAAPAAAHAAARPALVRYSNSTVDPDGTAVRAASFSCFGAGQSSDGCPVA